VKEQCKTPTTMSDDDDDSCLSSRSSSFVDSIAISNKFQKLNHLVINFTFFALANLQLLLQIRAIDGLSQLHFVAEEKKRLKKKHRPNEIRNQQNVIEFIHSWSDDMFWCQF
jgi:hypothetical protein